MNAKLANFLSCTGAALLLLGTGPFGAPAAMADDNFRRDFRRHDGQALRAAAVHHEVRTHERERRAFVAGAVAQQHRNDVRDDYRGAGYRDGYRDRYRERYYDDHDDRDDRDNKIGAALVGAAVGAVVTGVVMSNRNNERINDTSSSR